MSKDDRLRNTVSSETSKPRDLLAESMRDANDRAFDDRSVTENRAISDDDRLEMVRTGFMQTKLPNLPEIPGYHTCWLSSTSTTDTIAWRLQVGYELLKPAEIPGWMHGNCSTEQYSGYVGVNEMVGAKIRIDLFKRLMTMLHHEEPAHMESGIKALLDKAQDDAEQGGGKLEMSDDMKEFGKAKPVPVSW